MRLITAMVLLGMGGLAQEPRQHRAANVQVRILSTMLAGNAGIGEWGFAALVEVDGRRILFDTGARPDTVYENARELKIDLSSITDVILSHNHQDHTGGLLTLRRKLAARNEKALTRAHAGAGILLSRAGPDGVERNAVRKMRGEYEGLGGAIIEYSGAKELFPGVWLTGPVERVHTERNWSTSVPLRREDGSSAEDHLPEDTSLVIDTDRGLVVVSGCGHAGIINTLQQARRIVRNAPIHAAIGGWHLFAASDEHLSWTASKLKEFGLQNFLGAHCTGIEAVYRIRQLTGLSRKTAAVGDIGAVFTLRAGIAPGELAR